MKEKGARLRGKRGGLETPPPVMRGRLEPPFLPAQHGVLGAPRVLTSGAHSASSSSSSLLQGAELCMARGAACRAPGLGHSRTELGDPAREDLGTWRMGPGAVRDAQVPPMTAPAPSTTCCYWGRGQWQRKGGGDCLLSGRLP